MHIRTARFRNFKRFTDLTVTDIPATAQLVILAGPNGVGKSSFFDGLMTWNRYVGYENVHGDVVYNNKIGSEDGENFFSRVQVDLHEGPLDGAKIRAQGGVHFRTAFRHEVDLSVSGLERQQSLLEKGSTPRRAVDVDQSVTENYQRLLWQTFTSVFDPALSETVTAVEVRERLIGRLRSSFNRVFPDLILKRIGGLERGEAFQFTKGVADGFAYLNLSAGEKAVLDLLLDAVVKSEVYPGAIWCIDEPEVHIGAKAQAVLLDELLALMPTQSQLFVASHSLGFMGQAMRIGRVQPELVSFLDLSGQDYDQAVELRPVNPDRLFWKKTLRVALDDVAELIAPSVVVMSEGEGDGFDARCYRTIFASHYPDVDFISAGNSHQLQSDKIGLASALQTIAPGTQLLRLRDRDLASPGELERWRAQSGVRVLSRRHLEAYLFDPEILRALCVQEGHADLQGNAEQIYTEEVARLPSRGKGLDDIKAASGTIYVKLRALLALTGSGTTARDFAEFRLAPLVVPGTSVWSELNSDIFSLKPSE